MELNETERTDQAKTNACVFITINWKPYWTSEEHDSQEKWFYITDDLIEVIIRRRKQKDPYKFKLHCKLK